MIDWNKRNGGFLSPESIYEDQLGNLSMQINQKDKEIESLKKKLDCDLQWAKKYDELFEENNRLNNIINGLEKVLNTEVMLRYHGKDDAKENKIFNAGGMLYRDYMIDILKELKEESHNDKDNESTSK